MTGVGGFIEEAEEDCCCFLLRSTMSETTLFIPEPSSSYSIFHSSMGAFTVGDVIEDDTTAEFSSTSILVDTILLVLTKHI